MTPEERSEAMRPDSLYTFSKPELENLKALWEPKSTQPVVRPVADLVRRLIATALETGAQVETLAKALKEWLASEDEFVSHMEKANTETWSPNYGDEHWKRYQQTIASARAALKAIEG